MKPHKLSASALSTFLKSPRQYYYRYILRLEPIQKSVANFSHDLLFGSLWAEFTDSFYKGVVEDHNTKETITKWLEGSEGWVPDKARDVKTKALTTLTASYYQMFRPDDGCRAPDKSELWLENDRFCAKLDGLSDEGIVHEVKSTSRCPSLSEQLWKIGNSIQVKLYCILADAKGYCIEFAYKDPPHQIYRGPVSYVSDGQKQRWERELNALGDSIYALGDNPDHYTCHTECCLITKGFVSPCAYQVLCDQGLTEVTRCFFKQREHTS